MSAARLRAAIDGIANAWDDTLEPARRATESHAVTRLVHPPLPIDADTLDKRATCHERLAWWSRQVIKGQRLQRLPDITVPALCAFLRIHSEWLAASVHGTKALTELESSASALGVIAAQNAPKRMQVGACPGTTNGLPCSGIVEATVRADDDKLPSEMACDALPSHRWPASEWKTLRRRLHADVGAARRVTIARLGGMDMAAMMRLAQAIDCDVAHTPKEPRPT